MEKSDRRKFTRVQFDAVIFVVHCGERHVAGLVDVSLKGALCRLDRAAEFSRGERCAVTIALPGSTDRIEFEAEIAHLRYDLVGVRITRIDVDSMIHLRSLIECATANFPRIREEVAGMVRGVGIEK